MATKVPASFFKFQSLITEALVAEAITEVGDEPVAGETNTKLKSLSFLCDNVLASLHAEEDFRDAVVDSRANPADGSILLIINSEFEKMDELLALISSIEHVAGVGKGEREDPKTKEKVVVVKIKGHGTDCNPGDEDKDKQTKVANVVGTKPAANNTSVSFPVST